MAQKKLWVREVQETSHALQLPEGLFKKSSQEIARELKKAAESNSSRSKARTPYQAAMSMLNYYINRAGHNLSEQDKERLEQAKIILKQLFNRE